MENMQFCQSCGMPLSKEEVFGTNADGTKNSDYCVYCYAGGTFTQYLTMDEMIERCIPFMVQANSDLTEEKARKSMSEWFPKLKRWKKT